MALATKNWVNRRLGDIQPDLAHPRRLLWSGGAMSFSGNVWVGGKKISVPAEGTTQYLKITFGTNPTASWVEAMPDEQMDSNSEVFDTSQTAGDLHLPGNFA